MRGLRRHGPGYIELDIPITQWSERSGMNKRRYTTTSEAQKGNEMAGTYKIVELVGTSPISFAEAVKSGVAEASKTIRHMDWFEVVEERGRIVEGAVHEFQVTIKVGFKIER
jgi:flavin-binding protein dodecin